MAVHIRLARGGAKKSPFYRVIVADHRSPRDGRFIESIGTYDPSKPAEALVIDEARFQYWTGNGAQPSHTVDRLLKRRASSAAAKA